MTKNHRRLARGSRQLRITAMKVILSALTARLLAVPTLMQAALPVPLLLLLNATQIFNNRQYTVSDNVFRIAREVEM